MADADNSPPSDPLLDQGEIDNLVSHAIEPPESPRIYRADGRRHDGVVEPKIEPYDFRNPVFLTEADLRRLRVLHEDFARYLSARLALFLRMECSLKMAGLTTLTYAKFTGGLPNPSHLCLFKAEPLNGVGILDINPRLALTLVDRVLGGRGHSVKVDRHLTEIEIALLEDILRIVLEEWCAQWRHGGELHPEIIGHENNGRFLQTSPKDAIVLALTIECEFGDCSESLQIGVPYHTIEPMVKAIQSRRAGDSSSAKAHTPAAWKAIYEHINLPARAEWDAFEFTLRELTRLRVGDVLELPADIVDRTRVCLADTPKFNGTVGLDGNRVVVKLSEKIKSEDPIHAHAHRH